MKQSTINTIVLLSKHLITDPAKRCTLEECLDSIRLFNEVVSTLIESEEQSINDDD